MEAKKLLITLLCVMSWSHSAAAAEKSFGNLAGRSRIGAIVGFRSGNAQSSVSAGHGTTTLSGAENLALGLVYAYGFRDNLTLDLSMTILAPQVGVRTGPVSLTTNGVVAALGGVRWYLPDMGHSNVKPYLAASIGPYIGSGVEVLASGTKNVTIVSPGGRIGAGLDIQFHPNFMLGLRGGYNFMSNFSKRLAGRDNFSGIEIGVEISWLFGKAKPADSLEP